MMDCGISVSSSIADLDIVYLSRMSICMKFCLQNLSLDRWLSPFLFSSTPYASKAKPALETVFHCRPILIDGFLPAMYF